MQGTRDYIKYLKRGYSRVTQLTNFEIRNNRMAREEAQEWIDNFEGKRPESLTVFLEYMGITEKEFKMLTIKLKVKPDDINYLIDKHPEFIKDELDYYKKLEKQI